MKRLLEVSAATNLDGLANVILVTTGSTNKAITLPDASTAQKGTLHFVVKKVDDGAGYVVVTPSHGQKIDGEASVSLTNQFDSITVFNDGANWLIDHSLQATSEAASTSVGDLVVSGVATIPDISGNTAFESDIDVAGNISTDSDLDVGGTGTFGVDSLKVGTNLVEPSWSIERDLVASSVSRFIYVAPRACKISAIKEVHSVVGGAGAVLRPRKVTNASAPDAVAGVNVIELTTADIDLTTTVNTTQTPALAVDAAITLAAGDKLALKFGGVLTGLVGVIVITFVAA